MPDQHQPHAVEAREQAGVECNLAHEVLAAVLLVERQRGNQLVVQIYLELREIGNQCGRIGVAQPQQCRGDRLIESDSEVDVARSFGAPQSQAIGLAQLGKRDGALAGSGRCRGERHGGT
ncbi:hypothetical protein DRB87_12260 [Pandoraea sp. XY-2]|nr:hypothetical protein DRB87_12260 [Pandoraea sp. XY-2]